MGNYKEILKNLETPFVRSTEQAWAQLQPKLVASSGSETKVRTISRRPFYAVAGAAAAIIVAVVLFWPQSKLMRYETAFQQTSDVVLPDFSEVKLNAGSVLTFDDNWENERTLKLDGQAFFKVKKGSKFTVVTDLGLVEVVGTSFDVFSREDKFRVECRTGKVQVSLKADKGFVEITPGHAVELTGGELIMSSFDSNNPDWQTGEFVYEDEPIQNVLDEMARQFNVKITTNIQGKRLYTGRFDNEDLKKALELVCLPMSLSFEIGNDNQVLISDVAR